MARDTAIPSHPRYKQIGDSMRVLARREPTLATHVHVGVANPADAIRLLNRLRTQLPLLLALSANSPFWRGRPTGFASTRTTLFDAFPRSGLPRRFRDYADWVASVERLLRAGAISDPSFLWWDARLQPRYGTVEVRIMDAQSSVEDVAAVAALVQALASLELDRRDDPGAELRSDELVEENRFLAARDGIAALLIDELTGRRLPAIEGSSGCSTPAIPTPGGSGASASSTPRAGLSAATAPSANSPRGATTATCAASPPTSPTPTSRPRPQRSSWRLRPRRNADAFRKRLSGRAARRPPATARHRPELAVRFAEADDEAHYACVCGHAFKASVTASVPARAAAAQPW